MECQPVPFERSEHAEPMAPALAALLADADLGVRRGVVELAGSSPRWVRAFTGLVAALAPTRPADALALEHIGSTSVPGLPAKAILDVAIGQRPGSDPLSVHEWLMRAGHLYRGEGGEERPDRIYALELEPGLRLVNVHVLDHGGEQWRRYLTFRDHLRTHPAERDAYGELKRRLAIAHPEDRLAYVQAKGSFITARHADASEGHAGVPTG
ncbi:hypothetical protein GCM10023160_14060 [Brachybacterium paraconglomeratum]|uniref:GrpB family protein n=1 Tax=Brachybacterium paraconglomeratum TaxID=173362 RepID=UPI0031E88B94